MSLFESEILIDADHNERLENLKRKLAKDPDNFELNKLFAKHLVDYSTNKKNARIALTHLKRALEQRGDLEARTIYITALRLHDEHDLALETALTSTTEPYESARFCNDVARIYLEKKEYSVAREKFEEGLRYFPDDDRLTRGLISALEYYFKHTKDEKLLTRATSLSDRLMKKDPEKVGNVLTKIHMNDRIPRKSIDDKIDKNITMLEEYSQTFPKTYYEVYYTSIENTANCLSGIHAELLKIKSEIKMSEISKKSKKDLLVSEVAKRPEVEKHLSEAIMIIDESINRNSDYFLKYLLFDKLTLTWRLSQFKEALYTCEDILRVIHDNRILYTKGRLHIRLGDFKLAVKIFEQLLDGEEKTKNKLTLHEKILACFDGLKLKDKIKHEKKIIKDLKKTLKEEEKKNSTGTEKQKLTEMQIAENLDKLDTKPADGITWNDPNDPEGNKEAWVDHWKKMKYHVSWLDHYAIHEVFDLTDKLVDFDESGIANLRIMSKVGYDEHSKDGGKSFYKKFKNWKATLETFAKNNKKCKVEYRMFFAGVGPGETHDLFHRRLLFDNEKAFVVPGNDQVYNRPKSDDFRLCKHKETVSHRQDYQETWDKAHDIEDKKFLENFIRRVIKQEKDCAEIIEKENTKLVSKIKKELLPKKKDKPAYVTDESKVRSSVKKIVTKFPEIADMSAGKSMEKVMNETKGKNDPKIVKKILKEILRP